MKRKIPIGILIGVITYFCSTHFVFKVPVSTGGYHWSTYVVGILFGLLAFCIAIKLLFTEQINERVRKMNKHVTIGAIIAILIIFVSLFLYLGNDNLTADEKYAIGIVENYQDMLKDPDSIKLRSDVIVIRKYDTEKEYHSYCFFEASGNNSYGATVTSMVYFYDGNYFGDISATNEMDYQDDENNLKIYLEGQIVISNWKLYGDDAEAFESCSTVTAKKIAKKLKINYSK